jgi:SNF2 family DNA or RNA helicase
MITAEIQYNDEGKIIGIVKENDKSFRTGDLLGKFIPYCQSMITEDKDKPRTEFVQYIVEKQNLIPVIRDDFSWSDYPQHTTDNILDYQIATVENVIHEKNGKALVAADMGKGKTMMVLCILQYYMIKQKKYKTLVIAPKGTIPGWKKECGVWTYLTIQYIKTTTQVPDFTNPHEIIICTYDCARSNPAIFKEKWDNIILDESHSIKNIRAEKSKVIIKMLMKPTVSCILMMSGTPRLKCHSELYNQLLPLVGRDVLGTYVEYVMRYCSAKYRFRHGFKALELGDSQYTKELNIFLSCIMVRLTANLDNLLPPTERFLVEIKIEEENNALFDEYMETKYEMSQTQDTDEKQRLGMKCFYLTGEMKYPEGLVYVLDLLEKNPEEKVVIYLYSRKIMEWFKRDLEARGYACGCINGETNMKIREGIISKLSSETDQTYRVGLLSYGTCSLGVTLCPGVRIGVLFEIIHTPAYLEQCEKKINRLGAKRPTKFYWIFGINGHDESILRLCQKKTTQNTQTLDAKERNLKYKRLKVV